MTHASIAPVRDEQSTIPNSDKQREVKNASEAVPSTLKPTETLGGKAEVIEFGGPVGATMIMCFSHFILYYVYYIIKHHGGSLWLPTSTIELNAAVTTLVAEVTPNAMAFGLYFGYVGLEVLFAYIMPGLKLRGRPDETGRTLEYHCNAYLSWWASLAILAFLHFTGAMPVSEYYRNLGATMTVAVVFANMQSLYIHITTMAAGKGHRVTGNWMYDFFMGSCLHPRIGPLDIKMLAEIRVSWFLLFTLTTACAAEYYRTFGTISYPLSFMMLAHFLYANATAKGEHYVPPTWDIFYEKYGWMLCYWNWAGVPFLYCSNALFIVERAKLASSEATRDTQSPWVIGVMAIVLLCTYYVWDTSQSQKNHFRLQTTGGTIVKRWTFPMLPWATIDNPRIITTARGTPLLIDGWYRYGRKIHYTCDIVMSLLWGLTGGTTHFIPYFYFVFFTGMIIHRYQRDMHRCALKYGADWDRYLAAVPHAFIPCLI